MRMTLTTLSLAMFIGLSVQASAQAPTAGSDWGHLRALPPHVKIHVASDKKGRTCFFESFDEEQLTCSKGKIIGGTAVYVFPRAEVKSVKLTRYVVSTVAGAGIGAGVGTAIGYGYGRSKHPADPNAGLDFSGLDRAADALVGATEGLVAGAFVGGFTDFLRGSTVYRRP